MISIEWHHHQIVIQTRSANIDYNKIQKLNTVGHILSNVIMIMNQSISSEGCTVYSKISWCKVKSGMMHVGC